MAISPDGKVIAVGFGNEINSFIYMVPVDTGKATRLTDAKTGSETDPSFSCDGKRIAYSYSPGNGSHFVIAMVNVDGSDFDQWPPSKANDFSPVLSPDNETLVFERSGFYGSYSPIAQPHSHEWNFYASNLKGANIRQITTEDFYTASPASISPNGRDMAVVTEGLEDGSHLAIYSLEHTGKPKLSLQPHVPNEADHRDPILDFPNYTPDGRNILFMAASNGKHGYDYDIYKVDLDTGSLERLTKGNGYATELKVAANGRTAAFLKWRSDWHGTPVHSEIYLLDLESLRLTPFRVTDLR